VGRKLFPSSPSRTQVGLPISPGGIGGCDRSRSPATTTSRRSRTARPPRKATAVSDSTVCLVVGSPETPPSRSYRRRIHGTRRLFRCISIPHPPAAVAKPLAPLMLDAGDLVQEFRPPAALRSSIEHFPTHPRRRLALNPIPRRLQSAPGNADVLRTTTQVDPLHHTQTSSSSFDRSKTLDN
jgi:hypothetical protein